MNKTTQIQRMIKEMKRRKVRNHEFAKMYIMSYTKRISDIRQMGITVTKQRVYDSQGKATGVFEYWIPRQRKAKTVATATDGMHWEEVSKDWKNSKLNLLARS